MGMLLLLTTATQGAQPNGAVAVYSAISPVYKRTTLPDGSLKPETYAFGEGGDRGGPQADPSIDHLKFNDIAAVIEKSLASQNYVRNTTSDPRKTDLLIVVYWGTTIGSNDNGGISANPLYQTGQALLQESSGMKYTDSPTADRSGIMQAQSMIESANEFQDQQTWENAKTLGYLPELKKLRDLQTTELQHLQVDLMNDLEENRYFVVVMAYDFQKIIRKKEKQLLWQTRYSIREHKNGFDLELAAMSQYASRYFGKDSGGLLRKPLAETNVTVGDTKFLGFEGEEKKK